MRVVPNDVLEMSDRDATTVRFKVPPGRMMWEMISRFGTLWISILACILLLGIMVSFFDVRFLIVALMVIFIIIPMLMAMFYLNYGLREECFVNSVPHTLRHTGGGLEATLVFTSPSEEGEDETVDKVRRMSFTYDEISSLSVGGSDTVALLRKPLRGFIVIPRSAFAVEDDYYTFTRVLREKVYPCYGSGKQLHR